MFATSWYVVGAHVTDFSKLLVRGLTFWCDFSNALVAETRIRRRHRRGGWTASYRPPPAIRFPIGAFDGVITQRLLDIASEKKIATVVGVKMGNVTKVPDTVEILTRDDLQ